MKIRILLLPLMLLGLVACGNSQGKTLAVVKAAYIKEQYTVVNAKMSGTAALSGFKNTDAIVVLFFSSVSAAVKAKPLYDSSAQIAGQSCKQDGKNIYYGTAPAMTIYENIGKSASSSLNGSNADNSATGKSLVAIRAAYASAGYTVISDTTVANITTYIAYKIADSITVIVYPTNSEAIMAKSGVESQASGSGYIVKQDGRNLYFGTIAAVTIYDNIANSNNVNSSISSTSIGSSSKGSTNISYTNANPLEIDFSGLSSGYHSYLKDTVINGWIIKASDWVNLGCIYLDEANQYIQSPYKKFTSNIDVQIFDSYATGSDSSTFKFDIIGLNASGNIVETKSITVSDDMDTFGTYDCLSFRFANTSKSIVAIKLIYTRKGLDSNIYIGKVVIY